MARLGIWVTAVAALAFLAGPAGADAPASKPAKSTGDGKSIFEKYKCRSCHPIASAKIEKKADPTEEEKPGEKKPPDLSAVGLRHKPEWIVLYLQKKEAIETRKHMKKFRGTDAELQTLAAWLGTLKDESAAKKEKESPDKEAAPETKTGE